MATGLLVSHSYTDSSKSVYPAACCRLFCLSYPLSFLQNISRCFLCWPVLLLILGSIQGFHNGFWVFLSSLTTFASRDAALFTSECFLKTPRTRPMRWGCFGLVHQICGRKLLTFMCVLVCVSSHRCLLSKPKWTLPRQTHSPRFPKNWQTTSGEVSSQNQFSS